MCACCRLQGLADRKALEVKVSGSELTVYSCSLPPNRHKHGRVSEELVSCLKAAAQHGSCVKPQATRGLPQEKRPAHLAEDRGQWEAQRKHKVTKNPAQRAARNGWKHWAHFSSASRNIIHLSFLLRDKASLCCPGFQALAHYHALTPV